MPPLHDALRRELEKTVIKARDAAEKGAAEAIKRLAVADRDTSKAHLSDEDGALRNRLRARARQLGDRRDERAGTQATGKLAREVAYEAWHRMLFARFLAENRLLIHPELGVAVSLDECEELAAELGTGDDGWDLASRYAARMLPEIFRPDDPVLQVRLAPEHQRDLERLLAGLAPEAFRADDALGWVYQFWQSAEKKRVNESGEKITGETLPAVTQLFTEPYMVSFLLENTVGAWWAGRHPGAEPPVPMPYLRRLNDGRTPAAGTFGGWPQGPNAWREFTLLDPCCGSGHFLVAALRLIAPLRMHDEGLGAREAVDACLRENLHGLELDARCTQIAAFAVALGAWTYPGAGGYRALPELHVACSGTPVGGQQEEWTALARGDVRAEAAIRQLHNLFSKEPQLGSLINPAQAVRRHLWSAGYDEIAGLVARESRDGDDTPDAEATLISAKGVLYATQLLARTYTVVATNVPYLARGRQGQALRDHCEAVFPLGKHDLATAFLLRGLELTTDAGTVALVTPQAWLYLS